MKAVILVGGEGTRLRPLTCNLPKAIVPVLNRPFLEHLLRYLQQHGITDVVLAMGYQPAAIQRCMGDGARLGVRLTYSVEDSPLGTAGAVKLAAARLDDTFLVLNGDVLTQIDLTAMIKRHREAKPKLSIALTPVDNPTAFGVVETDDSGMVQRFVEKPPPEKVTTNMINAGIYIMEPDVLEMIPTATRFMFERDVFPPLLANGAPVLAYPSQAYWIDIGTPQKYLQAHDDLLRERGTAIITEGKTEIHPAARLTGTVLIGAGCQIAPGARITGPAVLGAGCKVSKDTVIEGSVLWDSVTIDDKSFIRRSIIGAGSRIAGSRLQGCVVGDNITIRKDLPPGSRAWPDGKIESGIPLK
ncbi:MAG: NDP-sugar synthase [Dehalococcoidales bacterium]|nr:NDP-sugar synthase [Dehalococcoidales bacterium]